jgi:hypothetical protein
MVWNRARALDWASSGKPFRGAGADSLAVVAFGINEHDKVRDSPSSIIKGDIYRGS